MPEEKRELSEVAWPASGELSEDQLVVVSVITCSRRASLNDLLVSFGDLEHPVNARVVFLVVENGRKEVASYVVEREQSQFSNFSYVEEPTRGIPFARNRAIKEALSMGADALCFIDDDEKPDQAWLKNLVETWRVSGAVLIGGPVYVTSGHSDLSFVKRLINASLVARQVRKNRKTQRRASKGGKFTVVTNNWLCDLRWLRENGLRFDESFQFSGGSDTAFFRAAKILDASAAWSSKSIVWETQDRDRLSIAYQFNRARCQSITHFGISHSVLGPGVVLATVLVALLRSVTGLLLVGILKSGVRLWGGRSRGWRGFSVTRLVLLRTRQSQHP